eukprot:SAG31_NODE_10209_length_1170_cov_1.675070_1_plen_167_part_00
MRSCASRPAAGPTAAAWSCPRSLQHPMPDGSDADAALGVTGTMTAEQREMISRAAHALDERALGNKQACAPQNISKHLKTSQNISKHLKISQNISKHLKTSQNISKYLKISQNISKYLRYADLVEAIESSETEEALRGWFGALTHCVSRCAQLQRIVRWRFNQNHI